MKNRTNTAKSFVCPFCLLKRRAIANAATAMMLSATALCAALLLIQNLRAV